MLTLKKVKKLHEYRIHDIAKANRHAVILPAQMPVDVFVYTFDDDSVTKRAYDCNKKIVWTERLIVEISKNGNKFLKK